jgi:hypothetical protein
MKWFHFPCLLLLPVLVLTGGCLNKKKSDPAIASEVEEGFKSRWIARRMAELQASGAATDARQARVMATEEFRKKYEYTSAAQKADPMVGSSPAP